MPVLDWMAKAKRVSRDAVATVRRRVGGPLRPTMVVIDITDRQSLGKVMSLLDRSATV